jgi:programmed cell death 8 (apoptosis-inducing factor)
MLRLFGRTLVRNINSGLSKGRNQVNHGRKNGGFRNYSTGAPGDNKSDRFWAIGAMTLSIPALAWLYNYHNKEAIHSSASRLNEVEVNDLKALQKELAAHGTTSEVTIPSDTDVAPISAPLIRATYLLIGGGTASFAAMEEIRGLEPSADILIVSDEEYPPYLRPPLSKELWFNADLVLTNQLVFSDWHGERKPIFFQPPEYFEVNHVDQCIGSKTRLLLGRRVVDLDVQGRTVTLDDGRVIAYEKVLLSTGGRPRMLATLAEAPVEIRRHVSTFRTLDDFKKLQATLGHNKHIAVVGGGFLGSELSVALAQYSRNHLEGSLQISQFFPEDGNMALVFPRYLSRWTMSRLKRAGIRVIPNARLATVSYNDTGKPVILHLDNGNELKVDHVLVAIGIEPNVDLAERAGLEIDQERGGILTTAELQVRADVFAAGDAISFHDSGLGLRRRVEHYDHAILSGKTAGANMVDPLHMRPYNVQSMFWSDLGPEIGYEAVGLIDSRLTTVGVWAEATPEDSPRAADLDPSDIRSQVIGSITSRSVEPTSNVSSSAQTVVPSPSGEKTYGKGVVFYVKDRRVVGMVMFNLFNRLALARDILEQRRHVDDLQNLVELFNIGERNDESSTTAQ